MSNQKEERILLGMNRPPVPPDTRYVDADGTVKFAAVLICPCGQDLWSLQAIRGHWENGHFDTPVYATKEEMMDRMAKRSE